VWVIWRSTPTIAIFAVSEHFTIYFCNLKMRSKHPWPNASIEIKSRLSVSPTGSLPVALCSLLAIWSGGTADKARAWPHLSTMAPGSSTLAHVWKGQVNFRCSFCLHSVMLISIYDLWYSKQFWRFQYLVFFSGGLHLKIPHRTSIPKFMTRLICQGLWETNQKRCAWSRDVPLLR
jgi:hypothetical protein